MTTDDAGGAPVGFDRLDRIYDRLAGDERFARIERQPPTMSDQPVCAYDDRLAPSSVDRATLEVVWFENDEFSIHYHETHEDGSFDHRWDRHPSGYNIHDHVHPGPDAPTPEQDATHPTDWCDVLTEVLAAVDERQRVFWQA